MPELSRIERPSIRVTRSLLPAVEKRMAELFDARFNVDDTPLSRDALVAAMADCDVLVPTVTDSIDAHIIAAAPPRLKLIASYGAGVNHIDLAAAKAKGIMVTNTPGVFTDDTADLTMALILNVPRRLGEGQRIMRNGEWRGWSPTGMLGHRIGAKTLGIIGLGRIGEAVAMRAKAFGLNIIYNKRHRLPASVEDELGIIFEPDIDRLMARSDIISLLFGARRVRKNYCFPPASRKPRHRIFVTHATRQAQRVRNRRLGIAIMPKTRSARCWSQMGRMHGDNGP